MMLVTFALGTFLGSFGVYANNEVMIATGIIIVLLAGVGIEIIGEIKRGR